MDLVTEPRTLEHRQKVIDVRCTFSQQSQKVHSDPGRHWLIACEPTSDCTIRNVEVARQLGLPALSIQSHAAGKQ